MHKGGYPYPNMPPPPMSPAPGPPSDVDDTNLYVTQLPEVFSEIQLHELFGRFGPIVSTRVIKDQCKRSSSKLFQPQINLLENIMIIYALDTNFITKTALIQSY